MAILYEGESLEVRSGKCVKFLVRGTSGGGEAKGHVPQISRHESSKKGIS